MRNLRQIKEKRIYKTQKNENILIPCITKSHKERQASQARRPQCLYLWERMQLKNAVHMTVKLNKK